MTRLKLLATILAFAGSIRVLILIATTTIMVSSAIFGNLEHDTWTYTPGEWRDLYPGENWTPQWKPPSKVWNSVQVSGDLPVLGYPMRPAMFAGLNDTLQLHIRFRNPTSGSYSLVGKSVEKWFAPRIFQPQDDPVTSIAWRDSSELKWRTRYWWDTFDSRRIPSPSVIAGNDSLSPVMIVDVWNVSAGTYFIAATKTSFVPSDINAYVAGDFYEYYTASSGQDSINAYEALFWRAMQDSNFSAASSWLSKIFWVNSRSVPGWWLKAEYYRIRRDTVQANMACDSAIKFISTGTDTLLPNHSGRAMFSAEQHYLQDCNQSLRILKESLNP